MPYCYCCCWYHYHYYGILLVTGHFNSVAALLFASENIPSISSTTVTRPWENAWEDIANATLLNCQKPAQHGSAYHLWSAQMSKSVTNEMTAWLHCVFHWPCRTHSNYGNIMYDRRVVRGNTYAQHIIPTVSMKHPFIYKCIFAFLCVI